MARAIYPIRRRSLCTTVLFKKRNVRRISAFSVFVCYYHYCSTLYYYYYFFFILSLRDIYSPPLYIHIYIHTLPFWPTCRTKGEPPPAGSKVRAVGNDEFGTRAADKKYKKKIMYIHRTYNARSRERGAGRPIYIIHQMARDAIYIFFSRTRLRII